MNYYLEKMELWELKSDSPSMIKPPTKNLVIKNSVYKICPFQHAPENVQDTLVQMISIGSKEDIMKTWPYGSDILYTLFQPNCAIVSVIGCIALDRKAIITTITNLFVNPIHRHKGFASALLQFAENTTVKYLFEHTIQLWCDDTLVPFYEKHGYDLTNDDVLVKDGPDGTWSEMKPSVPGQIIMMKSI